MTAETSLPTVSLSGALQVRLPEPAAMLTPESPAAELMTDFAHGVPPMIEGNISLGEADRLMRIEHCSYKVVVDANDQFRGIITLHEIHSAAALRAAEMSGVNHDEVPVEDVMLRRDDLHGVPYSALQQATVRDVVALMRQLAESFVLIVDDDSGALRGLIRTRDVMRCLNLTDVPLKPGRTFADLQSTL